jgi:hypothetical protein
MIPIAKMATGVATDRRAPGEPSVCFRQKNQTRNAQLEHFST